MQGTRWGDSTIVRPATYAFSTDRRPMVGTSRTYQGKEVEANNDNKIGGLSPGPMYYPRPGKRVGPSSPAYSLGGVRVELDKRVSPGPCNYGFAAARGLGKQKVDSTLPSKPEWGMGSCTRDTRLITHLAPYHRANLSSIAVLGQPKGVLPEDNMPPASTATPDGSASRKNLTRALAVAMAAKQAETDPELAAALAVLHSRVGTLRSQREGEQGGC